MESQFSQLEQLVVDIERRTNSSESVDLLKNELTWFYKV